MINFKLEVNPNEFKNKIDYSKKVMLIGSCFSENIGQKLHNLKIPCSINPFGIIYNPESVKQSLQYIMKLQNFEEKDLYFHNEKWISFSHHGNFSDVDKEQVLEKINKNIKKAHYFLKKANILYITFGTFRAYRLLQTSKIVANCHKLPNYEFENFLLDIDNTFKDYCTLINDLTIFNPKLEIVFTVSPVRHWKDGAVNNQISKSYLFVLINKLLNKYSHAHYFPSYEIMMDDLRDYRFYTNDLLHPSNLAVDYIWEKFEKSFFSKEAQIISKKIKQINNNLEHRVLHNKTEEYRKFITKSIENIKSLQEQLPYIDFSKELMYFKNKKY